MVNLIYIADPMCSWCYGFGPELAALAEGMPEIPVEIVVGGLRAHQREPVTTEQKAVILAHWQQVHASTGLPFSDTLLAREGFVYDTEPACRAVVAARQLAPHTAWPVLQAIQHGFYAEARDVTREEVLSEIAAAAMTEAGFPIDAASFQSALASEAAKLATQGDFDLTKNWGVAGFPTLVLQRNRELDLVTSGYLALPALVDKLQALVEQQPVPAD